MKIATKDLIGPALDWAVDSCKKGRSKFLLEPVRWVPAWSMGGCGLNFSTDWSQGGPIIEREWIDVLRDAGHWTALKTRTVDHPHLRISGPTPLIAAMRCYVASKLGDEVDVPEELLP